MKAYIYFLSFLLTFAPVYANAILPALTAVAGSKAGKVVLTKTGGAVLRTLSPTSVAGLAKTAVGICAKNPLAFAFCTTVISAIKGDGWDITVINNEANNDVDVKISKTKTTTEKTCFGRIYYSGVKAQCYYNDGISGGGVNYQSSVSTVLNCEVGVIKSQKPDYIYDNLTTEQANYLQSELQKFVNDQSFLDSIREGQYFSPVSTPTGLMNKQYYHTASNPKQSYTGFNIRGYIKKVCEVDSSPKQYISDDDLINYYNNNISDDDITNIYNYDYSQHTNIKINAESDTGDNINNRVKNSDSENDKGMTETAAQKSKDKNPDYHPDKINDENCSKDEMGRYDKCGADRDGDDDTASTPASTPTPPDDEEPPPIECNSNGFYKKVCDWMDWTQEEPTKPTDDKPPVKDVEAQDTQKIDMDGSCPSPYELNFSIFGYQQNNSISYQPLCNALEMLKPVFVGAGALSSMFILLGYSRQSGAGGNQ